jgi:hypothetical protein
LEKNANFFAKNCQKSQKIVIIASTPWPQLASLLQECHLLSAHRDDLSKLKEPMFSSDFERCPKCRGQFVNEGVLVKHIIRSGSTGADNWKKIFLRKGRILYNHSTGFHE